MHIPISVFTTLINNITQLQDRKLLNLLKFFFINPFDTFFFSLKIKYMSKMSIRKHINHEMSFLFLVFVEREILNTYS